MFKYLKDANRLWSYEINSHIELEDDLLIELILIHGDIDQIDILQSIYSREKIIEVFEQTIKYDPYYEFASVYIALAILGEIEPFKYIRNNYAVPRRRVVRDNQADIL